MRFVVHTMLRCAKFEQIKTRLSRNGDPKFGLDTYYVNFLIGSSQLNHYFQRKKSTPKKIFIRLPFSDALSLQTRYELKSFLR